MQTTVNWSEAAVRNAVFSLALVVSTPGLAQKPVDLDLAAFLARVEAHNPELVAAQQQRAIADAESQVSRAYPNPELELGTGPWRSRVGAANGNASGIGITQAIELPSVRSSRIGAADAGIASADAYVKSVRLSIGFQARQAYADVLRRQEDVRIARESAELLAQTSDRVLKRVEVGEAPRFELVRAEAEALVAQNATETSRLRLQESLATLRSLTGNALPTQVELRDEPQVPGEVPPFAALQAEVVAAHPTLRGLAAEQERARQHLGQERALRAPQPAIRLSESRDPEMRSTMLGVTLSIPLWNRREGQVARALASIELAGAQLEQQRVQLLRELDSAQARFSIAQRKIQTFEAGLLRSAETSLRVAEAAYRFGERSFLEVLDAQRTLRIVRSDYNGAQFDRLAAWLDIERLRARNPFETDRK